MTTLPLLLSAILAQAEHAGEAAAAVAERHGTEIAQAAHVSWLWLIPFFPLLGSAINTAFGPRLQKRYGKRAAHTVAVDPTTHRVFFPLENVHGHPIMRVMAP